jgi:hypothetical protein
VSTDASPPPGLPPPAAALLVAAAAALCAVPEASYPGTPLAAAALALVALSRLPPARLAAGEWVLTAWAAWALLSTAWSVDRGQTTWTALSWAGGCALVLAGRGAGRGLLLGVVVSTGLAATMALRQALGGLEEAASLAQGLSTEAQRYAASWAQRGRVQGPFNSPDILAGFLVATVPVTVSLVWDATRSRATQVAAGAVALAGLVALVLTRSAGGALALGVGLALCAGSAAWKRHGGRGVMATAVAAVALPATAWALRQGQGQASVWGAARERWEDWSNAVSLWTHHPVLGVGAGAFESAFNAYSPAGRRYAAYVHNGPLQVGVELGLPGFLLAVCCGTLAVAWALRRASAGTLQEAALATGVVAGAAHHVVDYDLHVAGGWGLFCAAAALASASRSHATALPRARHAALPLVLALLAGTSAAAAGLCGRGVPRLPGDEPHLPASRLGAALLFHDARAQLALAEDVVVVAVGKGPPVDPLLLAQHDQAARDASSLAPWLPAGPMVLGRSLAARGDLPAALPWLTEATRRSCCSRRLREERRAVARALGDQDTADQDTAWLLETSHAPPR